MDKQILAGLAFRRPGLPDCSVTGFPVGKMRVIYSKHSPQRYETNTRKGLGVD